MPLRITLLAEAEAEAGRADAGLVMVDDQLATIERTGQRWFLAELHRARGEILLRCPPCDHAAVEYVPAFIHAIEVARSQAAKLFELQAAMSLARLWRDQGKRVEARRTARSNLQLVYRWFRTARSQGSEGAYGTAHVVSWTWLGGNFAPWPICRRLRGKRRQDEPAERCRLPDHDGHRRNECRATGCVYGMGPSKLACASDIQATAP